MRWATSLLVRQQNYIEEVEMQQPYYARPMFNTMIYKVTPGEYYLIDVKDKRTYETKEEGIVVQFVSFDKPKQELIYKMKDASEKKEWDGDVNFYRKVKGPADVQENKVYILRKKGLYSEKKDVEKNGAKYKLVKKESKEEKSFVEWQKQQISDITIQVYTLQFQNINDETDLITISQASNDNTRDYIEVPMSFTNASGGKRRSKKTRKARKTRKGTYRRRR
jgi:hypothetical protein